MVNNELNKANCDQLAMLLRNSTEDEKRSVLYQMPMTLLLEVAHEKAKLHENHVIEAYLQMKKMEDEISIYGGGDF